MEAIIVPAAVKDQKQIRAGEISFVHYRERGSLFKNRVVFNRYAISFVLNGQKEVFRLSERTVLRPGQGMMIPEGNSLMAEHSLNDDMYSSLIIFFPGELLTGFLGRYAIARNGNQSTPAYIHFSVSAYLNEYLKGLKTLIDNGQEFSEPLAKHKLEELLLVIYELYPDQLIALCAAGNNSEKVSLKNLVENNLFNKLTLDELAFLANRSVSSFKRDFKKTYGISPQKYIRERKLEAACAELENGKQASELYDIFGYENLSNFNTAFKKRFGLTPAAYRTGNMTPSKY